jgi:hypothetical protein
MRLSLIDVNVSSKNADIVIGRRNDTMQAMSRSQNLGGTNDRTAANMTAIDT